MIYPELYPIAGFDPGLLSFLLTTQRFDIFSGLKLRSCVFVWLPSSYHR